MQHLKLTSNKVSDGYRYAVIDTKRNRALVDVTRKEISCGLRKLLRGFIRVYTVAESMLDRFVCDPSPLHYSALHNAVKSAAGILVGVEATNVYQSFTDAETRALDKLVGFIDGLQLQWPEDIEKARKTWAKLSKDIRSSVEIAHTMWYCLDAIDRWMHQTPEDTLDVAFLVDSAYVELSTKEPRFADAVRLLQCKLLRFAICQRRLCWVDDTYLFGGTPCKP